MIPYAFLALELAQDRSAEADRYRLAARARAGQQEAGPGRVRHAFALALAALTRGSATIVRRLDDCVADDLGQSIAMTRS